MSEFFGRTLKILKNKKLLPHIVLVAFLALSVLVWQFYENNAAQGSSLYPKK